MNELEDWNSWQWMSDDYQGQDARSTTEPEEENGEEEWPKETDTCIEPSETDVNTVKAESEVESEAPPPLANASKAYRTAEYEAEFAVTRWVAESWQCRASR